MTHTKGECRLLELVYLNSDMSYWQGCRILCVEDLRRIDGEIEKIAKRLEELTKECHDNQSVR